MKSASNKTSPSTSAGDEMTNYEPTPEDLAYLNKIDGHYIGIDKPKVEHQREQVFYEEPDFDTRFDIDQE